MKKLLTLLLLLTMLLGIAAPAFAVSDNLTRYTELLSNYSWKLAHSSTGNAMFGRIQGIRLPNEYLFLTEDATGQIYLHNTLWFLSGIVTFSADEQVMVIMLPSAEAASKPAPCTRSTSTTFSNSIHIKNSRLPSRVPLSRREFRHREISLKHLP